MTEPGSLLPTRVLLLSFVISAPKLTHACYDNFSWMPHNSVMDHVIYVYPNIWMDQIPFPNSFGIRVPKTKLVMQT